MKEIIDKWKGKLENLKLHRAENCDKWSDEENNLADNQIRMLAEFINDIKKL